MPDMRSQPVCSQPTSAMMPGDACNRGRSSAVRSRRSAPCWNADIRGDVDGECGALIVGGNEYHDDQDAIGLQDREEPGEAIVRNSRGVPAPVSSRMINPRLYPATWIR